MKASPYNQSLPSLSLQYSTVSTVPAEDLPTHPAGVRLNPGVEAHVTGEHVAAGEAALAHVAGVGLAARVSRTGFVSKLSYLMNCLYF